MRTGWLWCRHSGLGDIHAPLPHTSSDGSEIGVVGDATLADESALLAPVAPVEGLSKQRRDSMKSAVSHQSLDPPLASARTGGSTPLRWTACFSVVVRRSCQGWGGGTSERIK